MIQPNLVSTAKTLEQLQQRLSQPLTAPIPPLMQAYLNNLNYVLKPFLLSQGYTATPINAREALAMLTFTYVTTAPDMTKIIDTWLDTEITTPRAFRGYRVPLRIFVPKNHPAPSLTAPLQAPVMVYFHGGGGMAGSVSVYDKIYKKLAEATGYIVVAPEYRLAPENLYPAGIEDAHSVLRYLVPTLEQIGIDCQGECVIAGDSAGGAITATLVQDYLANKIERDNTSEDSNDADKGSDITITKQILIYAALDYTLSQPSIQENAKGYLLETPRIEWYYEHYFHAFDDRALASPFWTDMQTLARHTTRPLPKTLNITAGYCPLRDEAIAYQQELFKAGFEGEWLHFADMIHTFMNMESLCYADCQQLYHAIGEFCKT